MSTALHDATHAPSSAVSDARPWEGRAFGGIVLAAFLLYGIGSAAADRPIGIMLVVVNSIAVALAGLIGFRLVRSTDHRVGAGYLVARVAEAVLLAGGIILAECADVGDADNVGYLLGMIALSAGSIPFCQALATPSLDSPTSRNLGGLGYAALAIGALLELTTDRSLAVVFALPGGLFELALGLYLVRHGFSPSDRAGAEEPTHPPRTRHLPVSRRGQPSGARGRTPTRCRSRVRGHSGGRRRRPWRSFPGRCSRRSA